MARYIDADELVKSFELSIKSWGRDCNSNAPIMMRAYQDALYRVKTAPTADVVEAVRCKDCKRRETFDCPMYYEERIDWDDDGYTETDILVTDNTTDDGYCNCGVKADGKGDGDEA